MPNKKILIGCDHRGFLLKNYLVKVFGMSDIGCFSEESCDYPDIVNVMAEKIESFGILICNTGIGMAIAANKKQNLRAALCLNEDMARTARAHNDANILCLPAKYIDENEAKLLVETFLNTDFDSTERHIRRLKRILNK